MPNNKKETPEIVEKIKELALLHYNEKRISECVGLARGTVKDIVKRHNIELVVRVKPDTIQKQSKFIELLTSGLSLTKARKTAGLPCQSAHDIVEKFNLRSFVRSRAKAAIEDKTLSLTEAQLRLPNQTHKIIGFENGRYIVKSADGFLYKKTSARLSQGDPRGKSGTLVSIDVIQEELLNLGYELIPETYTVKRKALSAICLKCNQPRTNRLINFKEQECSVCSNNGTSKTEIEILNWIKKYTPDATKFRFKGKTKGKEIDIFIPHLNLGIEYCGLYWHAEKNGKHRKYHYNKMKQANEQGIRLITIFEDEWQNRQIQVKNFLKSVLGVSDFKVFARKCEIKEISKEECFKFLDQNHIQGSAPVKIAFGLYFNNQLLGLVTGNQHHRQGFDKTLVLNRLVFKDGVQIVGGSSKLIKYLSDWAGKNGYFELISWSDNRWSEGNVYEKTGFSLIEELGPDYSYVTSEGIRQSKQSNQKKYLIKKGAIGNTELELSLSLGYSRIWDCGKKRWSMKL